MFTTSPSAYSTRTETRGRKSNQQKQQMSTTVTKEKQEMVQHNGGAGRGVKFSISSTSKIITSTMRSKMNQNSPVTQMKSQQENEYDTVKNLLRLAKLDHRKVVPEINTFSSSSSSSTVTKSGVFNGSRKQNVNRQQKDSRGGYRPNDYQRNGIRKSPSRSSSFTSRTSATSPRKSRKRHFREKEDVDEAKLIQKLLKDSTGSSSSKRGKTEETKPLAVTSTIQIKPYNNPQQSTPFAVDECDYVNNNRNILSAASASTFPQPRTVSHAETPAAVQIFHQPQTLPQSHIVNQSLMKTISSEEWKDPMAFLPNGMDLFVNYFTPDQIQILQLLNQRHILQNYQSMAGPTGNEAGTFPSMQGNIIEGHGEYWKSTFNKFFNYCYLKKNLYIKVFIILILILGPRSQFYPNLQPVSSTALVPFNVSKNKQ